MKKILIIIISLVILSGIGFTVYKFWPKKNEGAKVENSQTRYSQIEIKGLKIKAEVADNDESRNKGLSGRESLPNGEGMIFVFESADIYPFWMKDMNFAIDIIWIKDNRIVDIVKDAQPPADAGKTISYTPRAAADMVLEMTAGFCTENNVKIGDEINISK